MRTFQITIDVDAPAGRVWDVMSDGERWPEWTPSVTRVRRRDSGPIRVGSTVVIHQPKFPPALWTVTMFDVGRGFTWVSRGPGLRVLARHWVEATPAGSRATLSLELQGLLSGVFGRMTRGITERYLDLEARGLKARSEDPDFHYSSASRPG